VPFLRKIGLKIAHFYKKRALSAGRGVRTLPLGGSFSPTKKIYLNGEHQLWKTRTSDIFRENLDFWDYPATKKLLSPIKCLFSN
jgi:hypothetical protein